MISMGMVQVATHEVVHVIAVRDCGMPTARTVNVAGLMTATVMVWRTAVRIRSTDFQSVLVNVAFMRVVEVAIVEIIDVAVMQDGLMATAGAVDMGMIFMNNVSTHGMISFRVAVFGAVLLAAGASLAWASAFVMSSKTCASARV